MLRAEGQGIGIHVVQLAGCEPHWMAEGARIAEAAGADIIDINMGCPAKHVTNGQSGSALMRDLDHALTLIEATVGAVGAGDAEDAARLGRPLDQRAGAGAARGSGRRPHGHRAWPHALPVLQGRGRLGGGARRQGRDLAFRWSSTATSDASTTPTRRCDASGADVVMIGRARAGPAVVPGPDRALSRNRRGAKPRRRLPRSLH